MPDHLPRILVVEDDYLVAEMIEGVLEECGFPVVGRASDGLEAVDMTVRLRPDVVLMDVHLPVMDGIEAASEIGRVCPTPVVIVTAYQHREMVEKARAAGVCAFLVKPPSRTSLAEAIQLAFKSQSGKPDND